jgi:hypothetical protein
MPSPELKTAPGRWSQRQRLEFIDSRLFWERSINRGGLVAEFDISLQQASADLAAYTALAPGNLVYDRNGKSYRAADSFDPVFRQLEADEYLDSLITRTKGKDSVDGNDVPVEWIRFPGRSIKPSHLTAVLGAMRQRKDLRIRYQSMRRSQASERWVAPHALASDGTRWHMRAWCHETGSFRDFVLSRILEVVAERPTDVDPQTDTWWFHSVELTLKPRAALTPAQKQAIEVDYKMVDGELRIQCRKAMAFYYLRQLQLVEVDQGGLANPIELANQNELAEVIAAGVKSPDAPFETTHRSER